MNIHPASVLALMVLAHLVADYTLQGCLANLKQKKWWDDQLKGAPDATKHKYRNDYKVGLICHSLYWSLIVCLPLVVFNSWVYAFMSFWQGGIHYLVDNAKANHYSISLVTDQICHAIQILSVWSVWYGCNLIMKGIAV